MAGRENDIDDILSETGANDPAPSDSGPDKTKPARRGKAADRAQVSPDPDPVAEPPAAPQPPSVSSPVKRRSAWPWMLLLVLLAGAAYAGWQAPRWMGQDSAVSSLQSDLDALRTENGALKTTIADLAARLNSLEERPDAVSPEDIAALTTKLEQTAPKLDETDAALGKITTRLTALERAATTAADGTVPDAALAGLQSQLDQLSETTSERLAALTGELEAIAAAPPAPEPQGASPGDSLTDIGAALQSGAPYATSLMVLKETSSGSEDLIERLARYSDGVPTLASLQSRYPDAARAALAAARTDDAAAGEGGFTAFVKGQLGMRSLTPQAGTDPDAILSRAEAALAGGDLATTLSELSLLPDSAKSAMSDWLADAETRQDALSAFGDLAKSGG